jgi:hypothetical protein
VNKSRVEGVETSSYLERGNSDKSLKLWLHRNGSMDVVISEDKIRYELNNSTEINSIETIHFDNEKFFRNEFILK